jgi:hypothetical protein
MRAARIAAARTSSVRIVPGIGKSRMGNFIRLVVMSRIISLRSDDDHAIQRFHTRTLLPEFS